MLNKYYLEFKVDADRNKSDPFSPVLEELTSSETGISKVLVRNPVTGVVEEGHVDSVFDTLDDMDAYLTNPRRYGGQVATCLEDEGIYILNAAQDAWLPQPKPITYTSKMSGVHPGTLGQIAIDDDFIYVCTSAGGVGTPGEAGVSIWKRAPLRIY